MRDIDESEAPLLEHLVELRKRLLVVVATLFATFFACLYAAKPIFAVLVQPLLDAGQGKLIYTDMFEAFFADMKVAFFAALMITFPVLATQLWRFVAPGLYVKEKRAFLPFLMLTPIFFGMGAAFAYFFAMPWALKFLLGFQGEVGGIQREALPAIGNYLAFVTKFLFGFGVAFLLPILLMVLERAGLVTREQLIGGRRYAIVGAFLVGAVLTPPDAVSQVMLALPLYALYEGAILAIRLTRKPTDAADDVSETRNDTAPAEGSAGAETNVGPETPPGGGRVGGSGPN